MPNISSLTMPDGIVYSIKDSQARKDIEDIKKSGSGSGGSGSSGGGYAPYVIVVDAQAMTTDAVFSDAKSQFLANKPVLIRMESGANVSISPVTILTNVEGQKEGLAAVSGTGAVFFYSDGTIGGLN